MAKGCFHDPTPISILQKMRHLGCAKLTDEEWKALLVTELDVSQLEQNPKAILKATAGWFESCYVWSVVSMACCFSRLGIFAPTARSSFFCQAVDFSEQVGRDRGRDLEVYKEMLAVPSVAHTSRLPGMVLLHISMRVRITTQLLPPWAVQDSLGTVMEIDVAPRDKQRLIHGGDAHPASEMLLGELPLGVYVKLDNCDREFLPPAVCLQHQQSGFCPSCSDCRAFEGWVLVEPIGRTWTFTDPASGATLKVARTQLPLMPADACPLYSLQGATCDPGLVAHFTMPKRADDDIKWLIVYVLLSRVRSLTCLRSLGLTSKIRQIIEGGPPEMVAKNFERLFRKKIQATKVAAAAAKAGLGWQ